MTSPGPSATLALVALKSDQLAGPEAGHLVFTVTAWRESASYLPRTDQIRARLTRRRLPAHLYLFERIFVLAHQLPYFRPRLLRHGHCYDLHYWLDDHAEEWTISVTWEQLTPEARRRLAPGIERIRARVRAGTHWSVRIDPKQPS